MPANINVLPSELLRSIVEEFAPLVEPYDQADGLDWRAIQSHCSPSTSSDLELKKGLSTCSLVCRTWRKISLPLLFRTLRFQVSPECRASRGLGEVLEWLRSVPGICGCVKSVRFKAPLMEAFVLQDADDDDSQYYSLSLFSSILRMFPRLQEVAMQDILLKPGMDSVVDIPNHPLNLNWFSFNFRHRDPFDMCVTDVLSSFAWLGHVKRVSFRRIYGLHSRLPDADARDGPQFNSLDLSSVACIRGLTNVLFTSTSPRANNFRILSLDFAMTPALLEEEDDIKEFLSLVAPHLEEFHCDVGWFIAPNQRVRLDLSKFTTLKRLRLKFLPVTIGVYEEDEDDENRACMLAVANILSTLTADQQSPATPSSVVEHVTWPWRWRIGCIRPRCALLGSILRQSVMQS